MSTMTADQPARKGVVLVCCPICGGSVQAAPVADALDKIGGVQIEGHDYDLPDVDETGTAGHSRARCPGSDRRVVID